MRVTKLLVQVNGGGYPGNVAHHPGSVAMARQVFSQVDVSGSKPVDSPVAKADFRFAGQGDDVLPAGRDANR